MTKSEEAQKGAISQVEHVLEVWMPRTFTRGSVPNLRMLGKKVQVLLSSPSLINRIVDMVVEHRLDVAT